jgi:DNA-binding IclR family transcriptional regulator
LEPEELVEAIARRVVELLESRSRGPQLITASELARDLSIDRSWVYAHAKELGAVRLSDGPRGRLRFELSKAAAALAELQKDDAAPPRRRRGRPRKVAQLREG